MQLRCVHYPKWGVWFGFIEPHSWLRLTVRCGSFYRRWNLYRRANRRGGPIQ